MKLLSKLFLLSSIIYPAYSSGTHLLDCGGDYKVADKVQGQAHHDIERAGVVVLKKYVDTITGKHEWAILLGHDKNIDKYNFFAGKVEQNHKYTTETAAAEAWEEGRFRIASKTLAKADYFVWGGKQLFVIVDNSLSVTDMNKACKAAQKNLNLPACERETDQIIAVSLKKILDLTKNRQPRASGYPIESRTNGIKGDFEGYYWRAIENQRDAFVKIVNHLTGEDFR